LQGTSGREPGSTNRQDCRFGRRSRPQGERHGWRESILVPQPKQTDPVRGL